MPDLAGIRQRTDGSSQLQSWLTRAAAALAAAGVPSAVHDARRLAAHGLGLSWSGLWTSLAKPLGAQDAIALDALLFRRCGGEPLAYILGTQPFFGLDLFVGPGVLVPRPETEVLVEAALRLLDGVPAPVVADLGTGSGAIALALASCRPDARVIATDISDEALLWAARNVEGSGLPVELRSGDLYESLPGDLRGRIDLVVSNPPYIEEGAALPPEVRAEPSVALFAGPDGLAAIRRLAAGAKDWLTPGGACAFEIGRPAQAGAIAGMLPAWRVVVQEDLSGRPRVVTARRRQAS